MSKNNQYIVGGVVIAVIAAFLYKRHKDAQALGGDDFRAFNPMAGPVAPSPGLAAHYRPTGVSNISAQSRAAQLMNMR